MGKKEAKKRNKIETSLRHELLVGTKTKHKAPVKVVVAKSVKEGGEVASESEEEEEEELDEPSISSEPGISKVVQFEWRGRGEG